MADRNVPTRVQIKQLLGDFLDGLFDASLFLGPCLTSESVQRRDAAIGTDIARQPISLVHRDVERVAGVVLHRQELALVSFELTLDESREAPDAVIHVDNVVARLEVRVDRLGSLRGGAGAHAGRRSLPAEDLRVGDEVKVTELPAFGEGRFEKDDGRWTIDRRR